MRDLAAIVLAAGGSTRLGTPKQLLEFRGQTLLRRIVNLAIDLPCGPVVVVLGHESERMLKELSGLPIDPTVNPNWQRGIGSSIRRGVGHLLAIKPTTQAALLLLCDQPLINTADLNRLVDSAESCGKPVCVCAFRDTIGPPVLVRRDMFPALQSLPDAEGAKAIWSKHPEVLETVLCPNAAMDIDTAADLESLRRL